MRFEDWKILYKESAFGVIKYRVFAGMVFIQGSISGISGSWRLHLPRKYCPEFPGYYPATLSIAGGSPPNKTASIYLEGYSKNDTSGDTMWIYTNGSAEANEYVNFYVCYPYCDS